MSRNHDMNRFFGARPSLFTQTHSQLVTSALADDEIELELDEPPDHHHHITSSPTSYHQVADDHFTAPINAAKAYGKQPPTPMSRQQSLLTRGLLSTSHGGIDTRTDTSSLMARANSQASAYSLTSNHGLTSDGGFSSPARSGTPSPPLPTALEGDVPRPKTIKFAGEKPAQTATPAPEPHKRRTCISFAGAPSVSTAAPPTSTAPPDTSKRPCTIKFACGNKLPATPAKPNPPTPRKPSPIEMKSSPRRVASPFPGARKHRGSTSTVAAGSEGDKGRSANSAVVISPLEARRLEKERLRRLGSTRPEDEAWVNEKPKNRKPLTVTDTLKKENAIRQLAAEAAEEEAFEEALNDIIDEEEDEEEEEEEDDEPATGSRYMAFEDAQSDDGHETDDEGGFAESDDDNDDDPDFQFWTNGQANVATSADGPPHLELIRPRHARSVSESSFDSAFKPGSTSAVPMPPLMKHRAPRRKSPKAMKMRPGTPELPDSTDFVCGTLDEDKPLEETYLSILRQRKLEKQGIIPQDLDPSFPTSDPENNDDEEDEVTEGMASTVSDHHFLGGRFDESDGDNGRSAERAIPSTAAKAPSPRATAAQLSKPRFSKSPAPLPKTRAKSPAPVTMQRLRTKSPAPAQPTRLRNKSPAPAAMTRSRTKSPAPAVSTKHEAKLPAPRKLFGHSPLRPNSPAAAGQVASPPASPKNIRIQTAGLAERPGHVRTASLPHTPNPFFAIQERRLRASKKRNTESDGHDRGPIDIKQGLEERKQRRKEHYWRKHCRDHKDKSRRCAPGKGAERMRELGLEVAHRNKAYGQKLELMLSV